MSGAVEIEGPHLCLGHGQQQPAPVRRSGHAVRVAGVECPLVEQGRLLPGELSHRPVGGAFRPCHGLRRVSRRQRLKPVEGDLRNPGVGVTAGAQVFGHPAVQRQPLNGRHVKAGRLPEQVVGEPPRRCTGQDRGDRCLVQRGEDGHNVGAGDVGDRDRVHIGSQHGGRADEGATRR